MATAGVLTAMTVVMTAFTKIPTPLVHGYFNLGDTVILIAGVLFGGFTGAFVGAVGSAAADLMTGSYLFAPITLIVKGLEGYVVGRIANGNRRGRMLIALGTGVFIMVAGYFMAEATILSLFDSTFGIGAAIVELPVNLLQGGISIVIARVAIEGLRRAGIFTSKST